MARKILEGNQKEYGEERKECEYRLSEIMNGISELWEKETERHGRQSSSEREGRHPGVTVLKAFINSPLKFLPPSFSSFFHAQLNSHFSSPFLHLSLTH